MVRETIETEREVTETITEEVELWRCDDCNREFEEDELVPVVVDPRVTTPGITLGEDMPEVEREAKVLMEHNGRATQEFLNHVFSRMVQEFIDEMVEIADHTAVASLDVCEECLEDDFGVQIEEINGKKFEERNVEKEGDEFDWNDFKIGLLGGLLPLIGQALFIAASFDCLFDGKERATFIGVLLTHLLWVIGILSLLLVF